MSFRKPFRAVPIVLGPQYCAAPSRGLGLIWKTLGAAAVVGLCAGMLAAASAGAFPNLTSSLHDMAVSQGLVRRTMPTAGDYWPGCNDARAAGVTPLYAGKPGYREEMDGDGDGIACEPRRGEL